MEQSVKQELHRLVDKCNDSLLLNEVKSLLASEGIKDWWQDLAEKDKELLLESELQYEKGDFITHQQLMQQFEEGNIPALERHLSPSTTC